MAIDYQKTLEWLFAQLPMYQRVGGSAYKADLSATMGFSNYLGNPEKFFRSVHVAGTNGKGSTSHLLASIFQEAGYKTGLYTSPHLKDFRERIRIDGEMISQDKVVAFVRTHQDYLQSNKLSFFEMTIGMAFDHFRKEKVDIAILETGMGGRLDSTNIVLPELSVITNIGFDHTKFLGDTLGKIAVEKAGIIKHNIPVVIGERLPETKEVFERIAAERSAPLIFAESLDTSSYSSDLKGAYQKKNIRTVVAAVKALRKMGWNLSEENLRDGLMRCVHNTGLKGRWEVIGENPKVVCDTGHNADGIKMVMEQLRNESFDKLHIVLGVAEDKDLSTILPLFPKEAIYYFCRPQVPRGLDASLLAVRALEYHLSGEEFISVKDALRAALKASKSEDLIYVGGSTFVVAEVL